MKKKRGLPIPFAVIMLAGLVSLFSILADRGSRGGMVRDDTLQMQTVEQQRMAAIYFRILWWLSDITRGPAPAKAHPRPAPAPRVIRAPRQLERHARIELCTFACDKDLAAHRTRVHSLN